MKDKNIYRNFENYSQKKEVDFKLINDYIEDSEKSLDSEDFREKILKSLWENIMDNSNYILDPNYKHKKCENNSKFSEEESKKSYILESENYPNKIPKKILF